MAADVGLYAERRLATASMQASRMLLCCDRCCILRSKVALVRSETKRVTVYARRKAARVSLYAACRLATVSAQAPRLSLCRGYRWRMLSLCCFLCIVVFSRGGEASCCGGGGGSRVRHNAMNVGDAKAQWRVHLGDGGEGGADDAGARSQQLHRRLQPERCTVVDTKQPESCH